MSSKDKRLKEKQERMAQANELLLVIGSHGRKFFFSPERFGLARFSLDERGMVWFHDDQSGRKIYTHRDWLSNRQGFSHGGTLNVLVRVLSDFIVYGAKLYPGYFRSRHPEMGGDVWGYGDDMQVVHSAAIRLGIAFEVDGSGGKS